MEVISKAMDKDEQLYSSQRIPILTMYGTLRGLHTARRGFSIKVSNIRTPFYFLARLFQQIMIHVLYSARPCCPE